MVSNTLASYTPDAEVRKLGTLLNSLRQTRKHADYTRLKQLSEDQSDDAVDNANEALALLPKLAGKLPKIDPTILA